MLLRVGCPLATTFEGAYANASVVNAFATNVTRLYCCVRATDNGTLTVQRLYMSRLNTRNGIITRNEHKRPLSNGCGGRGRNLGRIFGRTANATRRAGVVPWPARPRRGVLRRYRSRSRIAIAHRCEPQTFFFFNIFMISVWISHKQMASHTTSSCTGLTLFWASPTSESTHSCTRCECALGAPRTEGRRRSEI